MNVFENYFETSLLLRFVYVKFRVLAFKFFHYTDVSMELLGWILICSLFIIFISYSPMANFFNSYESNEKLSILAIKMDFTVFLS